MSKILRELHVEKQIARHMQQWERHREEWQSQAHSSLRPSAKPAAKPFGAYISISREMGSSGDALAIAIAKKLQWQLFDREILEAIASRTHVREELVARFDERLQGGLDTYMRNLFTNQVLDNTQYLYHLTRVLLGIAHYGEAVIVGRGAHLILPAEYGVRVRVVAPLAARIQRLMHEHGYAEKRAAQMLVEQDKKQREFLERHFHSKLDDSRAYDLVLNAENFPLATSTALVLRLAEAKLKIPISGHGDQEGRD
jgi:cytidylate kinase